ncbi:MAG TPA: GNAT family N-acetyltransferase [Pseudonocardiaceae bacterium]|nr:GNAT family N-acetyltransferase [Pseudonocardiaceae bacterium]
MTDPLIRPRRPADLAACVAIIAETHRTSRYPVNWPADPRRWLSPPDLLGAWVAELGGAVVGHVALAVAKDATAGAWSASTGRPPDRAAEITRLCVAGAARRRSVGRRLLDTAAAAASDQGRHAVLGVFDQDRSAIALYDSAGWLRLSSVDFTMSTGGTVLMHCYAAP